MASSPPSAPVTPEPIFDALNAFQRTAALKTAIEIDLFTGIGAGKATPESLASHCRAAERGVRILCDYLVVHGLLTKTDSKYGLTPTTALFLDRKSPAYCGSIAQFLAAPEMLDIYRDLTPAVRQGGAVFQSDGAMAPDNPMWVEFARSMAPLMVMPAEQIAGMLDAKNGEKWKVLDIAAGHGLYGLTVARHNPNAEIYSVDWASVLDVADENARKFGVADRFHRINGSAFEVELGGDYNVVLLVNFLHHFDPETCERLLRKIHAATAPGGQVLVLEFVPNEDRVSPPMPATFSLMMLGTTAGGDAYTFREHEQMLRNAGFSAVEQRTLPMAFNGALIARK